MSVEAQEWLIPSVLMLWLLEGVNLSKIPSAGGVGIFCGTKKRFWIGTGCNPKNPSVGGVGIFCGTTH